MNNSALLEEGLLEFMKERHSIYLKRSAGMAKPWTEDTILQKYKFTNVFRELDKTTVWVRENIRDPFLAHKDMWFMVAMFRQIGHIPTFEEIMGAKLHLKWDADKVRNILLDRKARGEVVYTGAYMLNAHGKVGDPSDKAFFTTRRVLQPLWEDRAAVRNKMCGTLKEAHETLTPYHGWGDFTAYQVVLDLLHSEGWLSGADDRDSWVVTGPGGLRGLNRVMGRDVTERVPKEQQIRELLELTKLLKKGWPKKKGWGVLSIHEAQFFCCEYDKRERVRLGEGTPKATYQGAS